MICYYKGKLTYKSDVIDNYTMASVLKYLLANLHISPARFALQRRGVLLVRRLRLATGKPTPLRAGAGGKHGRLAPGFLEQGPEIDLPMRLDPGGPGGTSSCSAILPLRTTHRTRA